MDRRHSFLDRDDHSGAPVAMATSPVGTIYLRELGVAELEDYGPAFGRTANERVRAALARAGRVTSATGASAQDVLAALTPADFDSLAESYLASPENTRRAMAAQLARRSGEGCVDYLDRLLHHGSVVPPPALAPFPGDERAAPAPMSRPGAPRLWPWALGALFVGLLTTGAGAWFLYQGYERDLAIRGVVEQRRAEQAAAGAREAALAKQAQALDAENAKLRQRVERMEARVASLEAAARRAATAAASRQAEARSAPARAPVRDARTSTPPRQTTARSQARR